MQSCSAYLRLLEPVIQCASLLPNLMTTPERASRKDQHLHSIYTPTSWILRVADISRVLTGVIPVSTLPPFTMASNPIPGTPRVISPSPTPSDTRETQDGYFGPTTRSAKKKLSAEQLIKKDLDGDDDHGRARSRSRSPRRLLSKKSYSKEPSKLETIPEPVDLTVNGNGNTKSSHLSPISITTGWSWRDLSRSPSPLGLIPIHRHWRSFVHRHEVPRKLLHVSIGFFSTYLYITGVQTTAITPYLMGALIPIFTTDHLRHTYESLNRTYVKYLGAFMRESEYAGWNGVIWYLLGAWIVLFCFPKDVGLMGILLLSWCDTAASTVGRAYGRYTPRIRKGKSLAGSLAAFAVGVVTAVAFWGWLAPRTPACSMDPANPFMFTGTLSLPGQVRELVGWTKEQASISGWAAVVVMSLWTGFAASASEVVDIYGWDDNLTIPVLSGIGMWGFLKIFG